MQNEKILTTLAAEDFVGRTDALETLARHAADKTGARGLLLSSAPGVGASELLKQTYERLFHEQEETIPFYISLKNSDRTAKQFALRFLQTFLQQAVAFRHKDPKILRSSPELGELGELAQSGDGHWVDRLIEICRSENQSNNERALVRNCLSAPLRAAARGANAFVMIDDLHEAELLSGDVDLIEEVKEIFSRAAIPFVFAGRRRFLLSAMRTGSANLNDAKILRLEALDFTDAEHLAERLSETYDAKINEQTRDLIATQFQGNPTFIKFIFQAAAEKKINLDSFQRVEKIYADEIFGGRLNKFYESAFNRIAPNVETQKNILGLLYDGVNAEREKTPAEAWRERTNLSDAEFTRTIRLLNTHEIVNATSNLIEPTTETEVLTDYVKSRFRLEIMAENRAPVIGEMLSEFLKRAPKTMAKFYQRGSAVGVREILSAFDCQETPVALLNYSIFKEKYKGAAISEILKNLENNAEKIILPQIVYTAHTVAFYPPISKVTEKERSAVALGFEKCTFTDEDEIVWIAAEIDAKLEASKETTEFWCDRLEMVALMCNFLRYKLWLIAPEGFSAEAAEILRARNAFGSSRRQIELLKKRLRVEAATDEKFKPNEYEMIVPMGDDTELIAAYAVEEIARRHSFDPKAINQIKTALIEACINATEHSHSPDRKIYQKFSVEDDKIIITISNRGLRLADKKIEEFKPDVGRRGWGLKLMKTLMDEVKFEQVDDGTRISMVKYLKK